MTLAFCRYDVWTHVSCQPIKLAVFRRRKCNASPPARVVISLESTYHLNFYRRASPRFILSGVLQKKYSSALTCVGKWPLWVLHAYAHTAATVDKCSERATIFYPACHSQNTVCFRLGATGVSFCNIPQPTYDGAYALPSKDKCL